MWATVGAALKKIAVALLGNPKVLKTIGGIVLGLIIIIVMPVVAIVSIFNGDIEIDTKAEQTRETKRKFALWIRESSLDMAKQLYKEDNCASQSEFIEKAILFYAGYLLSGKSNRYLPNIITSTLKGIVDESDNRMSRMLFKLAVELAITMNLIAAAQDIDRVTLERLRGECVKEVKRINGAFSFDDAVDWQKG